MFAKPPIPVATLNHSFVSLPLPSLQWRCQYLIWDTIYFIYYSTIEYWSGYRVLLYDIYTLPAPSLHWRWGEDKARHGGRVRAGMSTYVTYLLCSANSCLKIFLYNIYLSVRWCLVCFPTKLYRVLAQWCSLHRGSSCKVYCRCIYCIYYMTYILLI